MPDPTKKKKEFKVTLGGPGGQKKRNNYIKPLEHKEKLNFKVPEKTTMLPMASQKGTGSSASKKRMQGLVDKYSNFIPKTEPGSPRMKNLEKSHKQLQEAKSKLKPAVSFFRDRQIRNVLKK